MVHFVCFRKNDVMVLQHDGVRVDPTLRNGLGEIKGGRIAGVVKWIPPLRAMMFRDESRLTLKSHIVKEKEM